MAASLPRVSYSTTSLFAIRSASFTDIPGSMGYTTDGGRDSVCPVEGNSSAEGSKDEMFPLGPEWVCTSAPLYSDGVVLESDLQQWATEPKIGQILARFFFHTLYLCLKIMLTL